MLALIPEIQGDAAIVRITPDSPGIFGLNAISGMVYAMEVADGEEVDILEAGTCLIEMPDTTRYLARVEKGKIRGPLRIAQVEAISEAAFAAEIRRARVKSRAVDIGRVLAGYALPLLSGTMGTVLIVAAVIGALPDLARVAFVALGTMNILVGVLLNRKINAREEERADAAPVRTEPHITRTAGPITEERGLQAA